MTELERTLQNFSMATQVAALARGKEQLAESQAALDEAIKELVRALSKTQEVGK